MISRRIVGPLVGVLALALGGIAATGGVGHLSGTNSGQDTLGLLPGQTFAVSCPTQIGASVQDANDATVSCAEPTTTTTSTTAPPTATVPPTTTTTPPTTTTTSPPPPRAFVPFSIPADCSAPVDGPLSAWLNSLAPGTIAELGQLTAVGAITPGCYGIDGSITLNNVNSVDIEGNGSTVETLTLGTNQSRADFTVVNGSNITLRNMTIIGSLPGTPTGPGGAGGNEITDFTGPDGVARDYEWQHGISFDGTQGALVDHVNIHSVVGDFIEAQFSGNPVPDPSRPGYYLGTTPSRNIVVQNSLFDFNGRQAFGLTDVDGFTLRNSTFGDTGQAGIDLELDFYGEVGRNITIDHDNIGQVWFSVFSNTGAGGTGDVGNVTFTNNVMTAPLQIGQESCQPPFLVGAPAGQTWSGYTVANNQLRAFGTAVILNGAANVAVSSNTEVQYGHECGGPSDAGVAAANVQTLGITNNAFTGEPQVYSDGGGNANVTVSGNTL